MEASWHARWLLALVAVVFLIRAALALAVIPPWQKPDEPQHLERIRVIMERPTFDLTVRTAPAIQHEILNSMAQFDWWRHVFRAPPQPVPETFAKDAFFGRTPEGMVNMPPVYYALVTAYLRAEGASGLLAQYRAARLPSIVFGLLTIGCLWAAVRDALASEAAATSVAALLAFHPQFLQVATAVTPDALVNLVGALVYWQVVRLSTNKAPWLAVAILLAAAILAGFTKRIGAPLLLVAGGAVVWRLFRPTAHGFYQRARLVAIAVLVTTLTFSAVRLIGGTGAEVVQHWEDLLVAPIKPESLSWDYVQPFSAVLFDSAWLRFGWMAYLPGPVWIGVVRAVTFVALIGSVVVVSRKRDPAVVQAVAIAATLVFIQLAAVYATYLPRGILAQGRYLFPALGPMLMLLWLGTRELWPDRYKQAHLFVLPALFLMLDVAAWSLYIVPAYAG
jgi:Predicted membrane protein (DUF2142)